MSWENILKQEWPDRIKHDNMIWELFKQNGVAQLNEGKGQYSTKEKLNQHGTPFTIAITIEQATQLKI